MMADLFVRQKKSSLTSERGLRRATEVGDRTKDWSVRNVVLLAGRTGETSSARLFEEKENES